MLKRTTNSTAELVGMIVGIILIVFLGLCFNAWLLGIVLSWFGVTLGFWKNFLIVFLIGSLVGVGKK